VLLTGDIEKEAEEAILESGADVHADTLKLAHHGSHTSTMTGFLLAVSPQNAVVSTGLGNSYGHPHGDVLERLRHFGVPVRDTAKEGTVEVEF
jgi:competence protein ComEC